MPFPLRLLNLIEQAREDWNGMYLIARREVRDQFRDWRIIFPILFITLFFPGLMNYTADQMVSFVEKYDAPIVGDRLIPFLLMIVGFFPISVSLVIALESFVGEKERLTIEPLLCTPLTDRQMYFGKLLASLVYPLCASYLGIAVYLIGIYTQVGWTATPLFLLQILVLTTMQAIVMVSGAVVVSSQMTSVRAANLLSSFIVIPMAFLIQAEAAIMFWGKDEALWWIAAGQLVIAGLLVRAGLAQFRREELLERELDTLNLKWIWRTFWRAFKGGARSLGQWYGGEVYRCAKRSLLPASLTAVMMGLAVYIGMREAEVFVLPDDLLRPDWMMGSLAGRLDALKLLPATSVGMVWLQNVRAILIATLGGILTFGVLGVLILALPFGLIGYFMASMARVGMPAGVFLSAFVLPHATLEVPAILLAGGAILRLGASLATPAHGRPVGEAWLEAFADWAKVMFGVVVPLLLGAAILELMVTPRLALWILSR
ncbi:MAG: stage II sporulation protein M [Chloroflexota bacterium]